MAFFKSYGHSAEKVPALLTVITVPCIFHSPSRSTVHLFYGCNGTSPCKDHSNVFACSLACCWIGQWCGWGGQQEQQEIKGEMGLQVSCLSLAMSLTQQNVTLSSKHMIFSFQVPVLWSPLFPLFIRVATSLLILAPRYYTICWNFSAHPDHPFSKKIILSLFMKHTRPSQWITPIWMCH